MNTPKPTYEDLEALIEKMKVTLSSALTAIADQHALKKCPEGHPIESITNDLNP